MLSFARFLIYKIESANLREALWKNAPNHLTGYHRFCINPENLNSRGSPKKVQKHFQIWKRGVENINYKTALKTYCDKTSLIIRSCSSRMNTNRNESFNASMTAFASKRIDYRKSYSARIGFAIGRNNDS